MEIVLVDTRYQYLARWKGSRRRCRRQNLARDCDQLARVAAQKTVLSAPLLHAMEDSLVIIRSATSYT